MVPRRHLSEAHFDVRLPPGLQGHLAAVTTSRSVKIERKGGPSAVTRVSLAFAVHAACFILMKQRKRNDAYHLTEWG